MEYVPQAATGLPEVPASSLLEIRTPTIVRHLQVSDCRLDQGLLVVDVNQLALPIAIHGGQSMTFGTETVTANDYFRRVIERGDEIDVVILSTDQHFHRSNLFWIHIKYVDNPIAAGSLRKKDDGLFAMRAKAGEKAERFTTRILRDDFGHPFPQVMCDSPGYFEIRYKDKKKRFADRTCPKCGVKFEIKKRNKDQHFRVSHSAGRPFSRENHSDDWHAFVFPDMKPRFVANQAIAQAISQGKFDPGADNYDTWADVDWLPPGDPPRCT